jgi:type 1 fimbriae regulatory protein FimB
MRLVALEKEEVLRLLEAAKRHGPRAHAMVLLAIRHGLRVSEVTGLRVEHVNLKEGWVRVERLKGSLTTVQTLERHPGQPLLNEVRVLSRWLRERREDGSDVLFVSSHGGQMDRSTFARLWRRLAEAAGLPPVKWHPHVAKHTTGTLLARSGASAFLIRQHLCHRSISSSQVYCTVSDRDASAAARAAFIRAF